eukprot:gb/GFBE01048588.1/.p1 GENE.gb/GFBE01048588.1/~~gb/GFBE01048588.1/.p1  ORF type:complete len:309 (+),score=54.18 gb/GFBE01048588.1/:1-927(+)
MEAASYGSADTLSPGQKAVPRRWRLNWVAMVEAVLLPWALFVCVYWMLSFWVHYNHTTATLALVCACLLVPAGLWFRVRQQLQDSNDIGHREPNWFIFLAATCSLAWFVGVLMGTSNWETYMKPYYDVADLAMIKNVNTRESRGGEFIDVGAIEFTPSTDVQENLTMGYKDGDLYCVAPIVTDMQAAKPPATYDFWAVGVNCCNPFKPTVFACGEAMDGEARGGLRLMDNTLAPYFRKAIQQAQEEYKIAAGQTTIFLYWGGDPIKNTNELFSTGKSNFKSMCTVYLFVSIGLVLLEAARQKWPTQSR